MKGYEKMSKLPSILPDSLDHSLENLSKPLTTNIGNTFGDLWYLVFGPISQAVQKRKIRYAAELEKFKQETKVRVFEISSDDRKEPNTQIVAQALEDSKYCVEEEDLRKMFSELIASSMMKSRESAIHPSFATILKQMSNDDAKALLHFKDLPQIPLISITAPLSNDNTSYQYILTNIWESCEDLDSINRSRACLESLARLGLIEIKYSEYLTDDSWYDNIYTDQLKSLANELAGNPDFALSIKKGLATFTQLGENFIACVCPQ